MGVKYNRPDFRDEAISHREELADRFARRRRPGGMRPFAMLYAGLFFFAAVALMASRLTAIDLRAPGEMRARADVVARAEPAGETDAPVELTLQVRPVDEDAFEAHYAVPPDAPFVPTEGDEVGVSYVYRTATREFVIHTIYPLPESDKSAAPVTAEPEHPLFEPIDLEDP